MTIMILKKTFLLNWSICKHIQSLVGLTDASLSSICKLLHVHVTDGEREREVEYAWLPVNTILSLTESLAALQSYVCIT